MYLPILRPYFVLCTEFLYIVSKQQTNDIVQPAGTLVRQHKTTYSFEYV
jgi:hypothetical protein